MTDEQWIAQLPQLVERFAKMVSEVEGMSLKQIDMEWQSILIRYELQHISSRDFCRLLNLCKRQDYQDYQLQLPKYLHFV